MKILLSLLVLLGACDDRPQIVQNYLGPNAVCAQDRGTFLCHQQVGDDVFTVLCISDDRTNNWVICANFPSYDPPPPATGGTCNAR